MIGLWLTVWMATAGAPTIDPPWIPAQGDAKVCVSAVPGAKRMRGKDRKRFEALLAEVPTDREALATWWEAERGILDEVKPHPAWDALEDALTVALTGGDAPRLIALADTHRYDGCLQAAAAVAHLSTGESEALDAARKHLGRAWMTGQHPEVAFLLAKVLFEQGELDRAAEVADRGLFADAEHEPLRTLRARVAVSRGEVEAVDDMEFLRAQGDRSVSGPLLQAYLKAERYDEYIALAAEQGAPLAGLDVSDTEAPYEALRQHLGLDSPSDRLLAVLHTSKGRIRCELFPSAAPVTVANFVGLATGTQPWTHPVSGAEGDGPLYEDVRFHRVIPEFMIQTGDAKGDGSGGPGYRFHDEIQPTLRFDRPGRLAMANGGPGTNGSQFFVTEQAVPHLDGKHTIFGQCEDLRMVKAIARVPRDQADRPFSEVLLERVEIRVERP